MLEVSIITPNALIFDNKSCSYEHYIIRLLNRAFEAREVFFGWFREAPYFDNIRRDPRFNELLKKADVL